MVLNFILEFLYQRYYVFKKSIDTERIWRRFRSSKSRHEKHRFPDGRRCFFDGRWV
ncbi:MAG: hypothetical protein MZU97_06450 [Bacillus subtilis]|nr:hypothetical protein [Bacillus subtilis]